MGAGAEFLRGWRRLLCMCMYACAWLWAVVMLLLLCGEEERRKEREDEKESAASFIFTVRESPGRSGN